MMHCVAVCCNVLQCVAMCFSVLQCVLELCVSCFTAHDKDGVC